MLLKSLTFSIAAISFRRGWGEVQFWLDYGARMYDSQLGRFHRTDPLAELFSTQSAYVYVINNPVSFIDYLGMGPEKYGADGLTTDQWIQSSRPGADPGLGKYFRNFNRMIESEKKNNGLQEDKQGNYYYLKNVGYKTKNKNHFFNGKSWKEAGPAFGFYEKKVPLFAQGQGDDLATASFIAGAASLGYDSWQNLAYDGDRYTPTKGPNAGQKTSVWKMNRSGNYATRNGARVPNSANAASKIRVTNAVKAGGVALNVVGLGFTIYDMSQNGVNTSNGVDFVMGCVAFVPGWGWAVSGAYFLGKAGYEYYFTEP